MYDGCIVDVRWINSYNGYLWDMNGILIEWDIQWIGLRGTSTGKERIFTVFSSAPNQQTGVLWISPIPRIDPVGDVKTPSEKHSD